MLYNKLNINQSKKWLNNAIVNDSILLQSTDNEVVQRYIIKRMHFYYSIKAGLEVKIDKNVIYLPSINI